MAPRRQIASSLALVAVGVLMLGCGSESGEEPSVSSVAAGEISAKLDLIQERLLDDDCEGAEEALTSLSEDVPDVDANQTFRDDLTTLLGDLDEQLASECADAEATTSSTSSSTTTEEDDSSSTDETETSTETTTTETTEETTESSTTVPEEEPAPETPAPPEDTPGNSPIVPPGQSESGGESGGVAPGFESDRANPGAER